MAIYAVNQPSFYRSACFVAFLALNRSRERGIKWGKKVILKEIRSTKIIVNWKSYGLPRNTTKQNPNLGDDNTKVSNFRALLGEDRQK